MDYRHIHTHTLQAAGETLGGSTAVTAKRELRERPEVATGQTAFTVELPINLSKLKSLFWGSDKAVTVTPYNGESAGDPIAIGAGECIAWFIGCGQPCPLADDVTEMKIANSSGDTAILDLVHLSDPTPDAQ